MSSNNVQRVPSLKCSTPVLSNLVKEIYNFPLVQTSGQITSISSVRDAFPVSGDREHSVPSLLETGPNHLSSLQPQICKYLHHETIVSPHVSRLSLLATPHPLNSRSKPIASYPKQDLKSKNHSLSLQRGLSIIRSNCKQVRNNGSISSIWKMDKMFSFPRGGQICVGPMI